MIRCLVLAFVLGVQIWGADILGLVRILDRNDTPAFISAVQTVEDANSMRSDNNKTILMYAVWKGDETAVRYLLDKGADVNAQDIGGATALHLALWKDYTSIALYLIEHGASSNLMSTEGMTPEDMAMLRNNTAVMEVFQKKKESQKPLLGR